MMMVKKYFEIFMQSSLLPFTGEVWLGEAFPGVPLTQPAVVSPGVEGVMVRATTAADYPSFKLMSLPAFDQSRSRRLRELY